MRRRGYGRPLGHYVGLVALAVLTAGLCYLAVTNVEGDGDPEATDGTTSSLSSDESPSVEPTASTPSASPTVSTTPPIVPDQRRADFTAGDPLPEGALLVDGGGNASGLELTRQGLVHGRPTSGSYAAGFVETELASDVRSLGFRVRFAEADSGAVTLVAWQKSLAAGFEAGSDTAPDTGFRLVAVPGEWTLSVLEGGQESVLAEGTYDVGPGPATFSILREGQQAFVVDPTGATTTATDPRVGLLAGPWASWGVTESSAEQTPAVIEAVWGG